MEEVVVALEPGWVAPGAAALTQPALLQQHGLEADGPAEQG